MQAGGQCAGATIYSVGDPPGGMFGLVRGNLALSIAPGERGPYVAHFADRDVVMGDRREAEEPPCSGGSAATISRMAGSRQVQVPEIRRDPEADPPRLPGEGRCLAEPGARSGAADDLLIRDHVKRSVAVLLRLGGCRQRTPPGAAPIEVDVSQEGFAAMTNLARTTAGTVLRTLEASGHVKVSYRRVRIVAPDALRAMLEG